MSTKKPLIYRIGHSSQRYSSQTAFLRQRSIDPLQDFDRKRLNKPFEQAAFLLFERESLLKEPTQDSVLFKITFQKNIRRWQWIEQRSFFKMKELLSAQNQPVYVFDAQSLNKENTGIIQTHQSALMQQVAMFDHGAEHKSTLEELHIAWKSHWVGNERSAGRLFNAIAKNSDIEVAYRAAALNGLAENYAVKNQWKELYQTAKNSLELCPNQTAAYFFLWQSCNARYLFDEAFNWISKLEEHHQTTLAIDLDFSAEERLHLVMRAASKAKEQTVAFRKSEELFQWNRLHENNNPDELLQSLVIQSLEANEAILAKRYMDHLIQAMLENPFDEQRWQIIDELMSMFVERKELDFSINHYKHFHEMGLKPAVCKRRLVGLYIKSNQIAKARELSQNSRAFFT